MNRKPMLSALALAALSLLAGIVITTSGTFAQSSLFQGKAPNSIQVLQDSSIADFNTGSLYHTELASVDDGAIALQSIGLAGGWADVSSTGLPPRLFHASVVVGTHIYVFGGDPGNGTPLATCYVTTIQANHTLAAWQPVTSLPLGLSDAVAVAVNNRVYVMGGFDGTTTRNTVYRATVNADGSLSAWTQDAGLLPESLLHSAATAVNGFIYMVGGERAAPPPSKHGYYTHPNADGSLAAWSPTPDLPAPYGNGVSGHIVTSYTDGANSKVFVATGFGGTGSAVPNVFSAVADRVTGALGSWTANVNYTQNLVYSAGVTYGTAQCGGNLFFSGGFQNQNRTATDYVATSVLSPAPDYFASGWYDTANLGIARFGHTMVASNDGWLYVIDGGDSNGNPVDSVRYGETACAAAGGATRAPSGTFQSRTLDTTRQSSPFYSLSVNTTITDGLPITLTFSYRFSNSPNLTETFSSPISLAPGISHTTSISLTSISGEYLQYQVNLARDDSVLTSSPYLNWVQLFYEGTPPQPTFTPGPTTPTATPGATGGDLLIRQMAAQPSGTFRLVSGRAALLQASVRNVGVAAVPAGTRLEVDFYAGLTRPPVAADPSDTFGTVTLAQDLQPGEETIVQASWAPPHTGSYDLYGWVDRNANLFPESDYTNNITGALRTCTYATDGQSFSDVPTGVYFYTPVEYLVCLGIVSGYNDGTFRPYNNTTRQQFMKMVTLGMGWPIVTPTPAGAHSFADMPTDSVFFPLVETTYAHGAVSGYACGGVNPASGAAEPCDAQQRPYFRPGNLVTRGQIAKILVVAKAWEQLNPTTPQFTDVPTTSAFYKFVETAYAKGILGGYTTAAQCPSGVPCFLPGNNATRGQISKMVYYTITQR